MTNSKRAKGKALADAFMNKFSDYRFSKEYKRKRDTLDARQAISLAKDLSGKRKGGIEELRSIPGFIENEAAIRKDNALHIAILEAKRQSGLSQGEIAQNIGMPQSNVSRIEHSRVVSFDTFAAYLLACGFDFTIKIRKISRGSMNDKTKVMIHPTNEYSIQH